MFSNSWTIHNQLENTVLTSTGFWWNMFLCQILLILYIVYRDRCQIFQALLHLLLPESFFYMHKLNYFANTTWKSLLLYWIWVMILFGGRVRSLFLMLIVCWLLLLKTEISSDLYIPPPCPKAQESLLKSGQKDYKIQREQLTTGKLFSKYRRAVVQVSPQPCDNMHKTYTRSSQITSQSGGGVMNLHL